MKRRSGDSCATRAAHADERRGGEGINPVVTHLHPSVGYTFADSAEPAQKAERLAVVLEAQAQHFGDGDYLPADGEVAQNFFVDVLGKQQGALVMA